MGITIRLLLLAVETFIVAALQTILFIEFFVGFNDRKSLGKSINRECYMFSNTIDLAKTEQDARNNGLSTVFQQNYQPYLGQPLDIWAKCGSLIIGSQPCIQWSPFCDDLRSPAGYVSIDHSQVRESSMGCRKLGTCRVILRKVA
jgi:hypothetical protein